MTDNMQAFVVVNDKLRPAAEKLAAEIGARAGSPPPVQVGAAAARPGDIPVLTYAHTTDEVAATKALMSAVQSNRCVIVGVHPSFPFMDALRKRAHAVLGEEVSLIEIVEKGDNAPALQRVAAALKGEADIAPPPSPPPPPPTRPLESDVAEEESPPPPAARQEEPEEEIHTVEEEMQAALAAASTPAASAPVESAPAASAPAASESAASTGEAQQEDDDDEYEDDDEEYDEDDDEYEDDDEEEYDDEDDDDEEEVEEVKPKARRVPVPARKSGPLMASELGITLPGDEGKKEEEVVPKKPKPKEVDLADISTDDLLGAKKETAEANAAAPSAPPPPKEPPPPHPAAEPEASPPASPPPQAKLKSSPAPAVPPPAEPEAPPPASPPPQAKLKSSPAPAAAPAAAPEPPPKPAPAPKPLPSGRTTERRANTPASVSMDGVEGKNLPRKGEGLDLDFLVKSMGLALRDRYDQIQRFMPSPEPDPKSDPPDQCYQKIRNAVKTASVYKEAAKIKEACMYCLIMLADNSRKKNQGEPAVYLAAACSLMDGLKSERFAPLRHLSMMAASETLMEENPEASYKALSDTVQAIQGEEDGLTPHVFHVFALRLLLANADKLGKGDGETAPHKSAYQTLMSNLTDDERKVLDACSPAAVGGLHNEVKDVL